jgi:hypothetical protein
MAPSRYSAGERPIALAAVLPSERSVALPFIKRASTPNPKRKRNTFQEYPFSLD